MGLAEPAFRIAEKVGLEDFEAFDAGSLDFHTKGRGRHGRRPTKRRSDPVGTRGARPAEPLPPKDAQRYKEAAGMPLLQDLADEGEDEEGEDGAPKEGVDDHHDPPEEAAVGGAEGVGDGVARLPEELRALEDQEADEVNDTQRNIREQERFHGLFSFLTKDGGSGAPEPRPWCHAIRRDPFSGLAPAPPDSDRNTERRRAEARRADTDAACAGR